MNVRGSKISKCLASATTVVLLSKATVVLESRHYYRKLKRTTAILLQQVQGELYNIRYMSKNLMEVYMFSHKDYRPWLNWLCACGIWQMMDTVMSMSLAMQLMVSIFYLLGPYTLKFDARGSLFVGFGCFALLGLLWCCCGSIFLKYWVFFPCDAAVAHKICWVPKKLIRLLFGRANNYSGKIWTWITSNFQIS